VKRLWFFNDITEENHEKKIILQCGMYFISPILIRNEVFIESRRDCLLQSKYMHLLGYVNLIVQLNFNKQKYNTDSAK